MLTQIEISHRHNDTNAPLPVELDSRPRCEIVFSICLNLALRHALGGINQKIRISSK